MRLHNKVAIVTGAARGIGRAIAVRFGCEGARVVIADIREDECAETAALVTGAGGEALCVPTDVRDSSQVHALIEAVLARWGTIDIVVNDAGICPFTDFLDIPEAMWEEVLAVNLKGYFLVSQAAARVMVQRGVKGRIIAVSSISAEFGGSQQAHYCASKAAINLLVKSMAISLGPYGITCNAVLPGTIETAINRDVLDRPGVREYWAGRAPLRRLGTPEDIAGPALFFATEDADWCTGALLVVDGGTSVNLQ
jgi:L-rhamnose 1-dehydrogenase